MSYEITVITRDGRTAEPVFADAATVRILLDEAAATGTRLRVGPRRHLRGHPWRHTGATPAPQAPR